jgi:hypothetical protein
MSQPRMTDDQRIVVIALLANAIRKHERGGRSGTPAAPQADLARLAGSRGRRSASQQYIRGMVDLLAVLFEGGRPFAEECYEEARRVALGLQPPGSSRPDLN